MKTEPSLLEEHKVRGSTSLEFLRSSDQSQVLKASLLPHTHLDRSTLFIKMVDRGVMFIEMDEFSRNDFIRQALEVSEQISKAAEDADSYRSECAEIALKIDALRGLMLQVMRLAASPAYYDQPARKIMGSAKKTLEKTLALVQKCNKGGVLKRVITITTTTDFRKVTNLLDKMQGNLKWLIAIWAGGGGLPPIGSDNPSLAYVWEEITRLHAGNPENKAEAASSLASLAWSSERNGKIIIQEGGLPPLIKLLSEGTPDGQENAARALMDLSRDQQQVQEIVKCGAISAFVHVLGDATVKVLTQAAYAVAAIASCDEESQSAFGAVGVIRPLVALINSTIDEDSRNYISSMHARSKAGKPWSWTIPKPDDGFQKTGVPNRSAVLQRDSSSDSLNNGSSSRIRRDMEDQDPETIRNLQAAALRALWVLATGNEKNCKLITGTRALLCFAKLIEKEQGDVQTNAIMAVTAIAVVAEQDHQLRKAAFRMPSVSVKAVVEQLLQVITSGEHELQVPAVKAIGCLSRIFQAKDSYIVRRLTELLGNPAMACEAAQALQKFTHRKNYLKEEHSKSILEADGASMLVQLTLFQVEAQRDAVTLLCNLAINAGDHAELKHPTVLMALEAAIRAPQLREVPSMKELLQKAIKHLEVMLAPPFEDF